MKQGIVSKCILDLKFNRIKLVSTISPSSRGGHTGRFYHGEALALGGRRWLNLDFRLWQCCSQKADVFSNKMLAFGRQIYLLQEGSC